MKILIVEDNNEKFERVSQEVDRLLSELNTVVERCETFSHATRLIFENKYDLILIDLLLPRRHGDQPSDISSEIVSNLQESRVNHSTTVLAISMHETLVDDLDREFHQAGITLLHYTIENDAWKGGLEFCLRRLKTTLAYDFIIFCALDKERAAFRNADCALGEYKSLYGIDCQEITIDGYQGLIAKPPRMGLVDASIISSRCLERFSPRLICMAGICAGFSGSSTIGSLVVSERAWEHQAGKWSKDNEFKLDAYQSSIDDTVRIKLDQYIKKNEGFKSIKNDGYIENPFVDEPLFLAPTVSGSSVIASRKKISEIGEQHRKLVALDMEVYGLYRAVELSAQKPMLFSAKTVVDLADESKGDAHHTYGATLSARFVVGAIRELFAESTT